MGSSNPIVRVTFNGIVQHCPKTDNSLNPVVNYALYFPVKLVDNRRSTPETACSVSFMSCD